MINHGWSIFPNNFFCKIIVVALIPRGFTSSLSCVLNLILMLMVAILANRKLGKKPETMTETLAHGYSLERGKQVRLTVMRKSFGAPFIVFQNSGVSWFCMYMIISARPFLSCLLILSATNLKFNTQNHICFDTVS